MYCKPYICTDGYEAVNDNFKGLIVYCGLDDRSDTINSWLTGRKLPEDTPADDCQIANIIRAMDYSLDRLDETFGKYKGVVYRVGFFNPISDKQFYSTSAESIGAVKHSPDIIPTKENPYAIIKIKNGHNLHAFQKQVNSYFSKRIGETEKEILIDRNSKFRLVPESEYTDTDIRLRNIMLTQAVKNSDEIYGKDIENAVNGHQDLLKYISIWEEI